MHRKKLKWNKKKRDYFDCYVKTSDQLRILHYEFDLNHGKIWSKDKVKELSRRIHMTETKIYKWNWDRRNQREKDFLKNLTYGDGKYLPDKLFNITKVIRLSNQEVQEVELTP